ncbi:hypothetical protein PF001_g31736 [Phytophthora fragariae]|uniref:Uncharacterized protein n=1 Tax=Phytophthora fragariae TaxID=53985 RepID=A0A6A3GQ30_9STRA|nr:hypothetical protein PF011_g30434 [Phytophthora fragariae]KAE9263303.1 hypothetical protein PF001_g31736 [Phytophthora fragariae]
MFSIISRRAPAARALCHVTQGLHPSWAARAPRPRPRAQLLLEFVVGPGHNRSCTCASWNADCTVPVGALRCTGGGSLIPVGALRCTGECSLVPEETSGCSYYRYRWRPVVGDWWML